MRCTGACRAGRRVGHRLQHPEGPDQVDLDGGVEGGVEAHPGRGVDDGGAGGEQGPALVVEAEPVDRHVARDHRDPPGHLGVEAVAQLGPQAAEGVVAEDLPLGPGGRGRPPPAPDEQDQLAVGHRAQQSLDQGRAQEPGGAGDADALPGQGLSDHPLTLVEPFTERTSGLPARPRRARVRLGGRWTARAATWSARPCTSWAWRGPRPAPSSP